MRYTTIIHSLSIMLAIPVFMTALSVQKAQAGDSKTYPASLCQTSTTAPAGALQYLHDGDIANFSTSWLSIYCPPLKDIIPNYSGSTSYTVHAEVSYKDYHSNYNPVCYLQPVDKKGKPTSTSIATLYGSIMKMDVARKNAYSYSLRCVLPPKDPTTGSASTLGAIRIDEGG